MLTYFLCYLKGTTHHCVCHWFKRTPQKRFVNYIYNQNCCCFFGTNYLIFEHFRKVKTTYSLQNYVNFAFSIGYVYLFRDAHYKLIFALHKHVRFHWNNILIKVYFWVYCSREHYMRGRPSTRHHDILHNDTLHNDIQQNDAQHNDIQYNKK